MISTGRPFDAATSPVPTVAGSFMGMGSFNLLWIGLLVTAVAITMNWRNSRTGYWLNLGIVGATDLGLLLFLLLPGTMAWTDGGIGLSLFFVAAALSTTGLLRAQKNPANGPEVVRA
jgi:hypothetical protein